MVGDDVKRTRCTTCEAEHEYKHAKVPRQRRKGEEPAALYAQVLAGGPKRVTHEPANTPLPDAASNLATPSVNEDSNRSDPHGQDGRLAGGVEESQDEGDESREAEEGPVHRQLIRATLPRHEGQPPPSRPAPDFTIRQPGGGRPNPFRSRNQHQRGGQSFQGNRSNGAAGGSGRGGPRHSGGRPQPGGGASRVARRQDPGRKRSK
jgi:hypothetical protein